MATGSASVAALARAGHGCLAHGPLRGAGSRKHLPLLPRSMVLVGHARASRGGVASWRRAAGAALPGPDSVAGTKASREYATRTV